MRLLVIGGSGLVGSHVLSEALGRGHVAVGTYRERPEPGLEPLNGANLADFEALLDRVQPDRVIHAAGWTWVDGCEGDPARAMEENCHQPVRMAEACQGRGIRFAYVSTSYIFDGTAGPYDETALPNPINVYARSKWEAEQRITQVTGGTALLPRVICVFGSEVRRKNFACQVCDAMRSGRTMTLPSDQLGNPTWAGDIARATVDLLGSKQSGIFHLGGANPRCSRVEWAEALIDTFRQLSLSPAKGFRLEVKSTAELGQPARRPLHGGMVSLRMPRPVFEEPPWVEICSKIVG